eukprot:Skav222975  [mRNA]  locus=scaffold1489:869465:878714:- [translate_table: standard]
MLSYSFLHGVYMRQWDERSKSSCLLGAERRWLAITWHPLSLEVCSGMAALSVRTWLRVSDWESAGNSPQQRPFYRIGQIEILRNRFESAEASLAQVGTPQGLVMFKDTPVHCSCGQEPLTSSEQA